MILSTYTILFKDNSRYYLFNSESLYFLEISEELFDILKDNDWQQIPDDLMKTLRDKHVVLPDEDKYSFFYDERTQFLTNAYGMDTMSLIIAPTTGCNFACPYCFEPKKNPKSLTKDIEDKIIEYINNQEHIDKISLTWYGGEPLLMIDAIERLYGRIKTETEKKIAYQEMISNAYLLNEHAIEIIKAIGLNRIQISIDGVEERHNKTRFLKGTGKPTYKIIESNIENLAKAMPDLRISLRINIDKDNPDDFVALYEKYHIEPWHKNISLYPGLIRRDTPDGCGLCHSSYGAEDLVELYINLREKGVNSHFFPRRLGKGCMMQRSSAFIVGPEGELYKCWDDVSKPDKVVGSIIDNNRRNYPLLMRYMHECGPIEEECKECAVFPICDGGCGYMRHRSKFEGGRFTYCSPYKDMEKLKKALLRFSTKNEYVDKKRVTM